MKRRRFSPMAAFAVVGMLVPAFAPAAPAPGRTAPPSFASTGIAGSGSATMQQVFLPARLARVVEVPGARGSEAWGIGLSSANVAGWHIGDPQGQVLFMHYTPANGWQVHAPPVDSDGRIANPALYSLDVTSSGEGWAVGDEGVIVHRLSGGRWTITDQSGRITTNTIRSVSLVGNEGFAVGDGPTILRLRGGRWQADTNTNLISGDVVAVAAVSGDEAWAVSGGSSKDVTVYHRTSSGWSKVATQTIFDGPHPAVIGDGLIAKQSQGASIAATPDGGAWIGGLLYVTDATAPLGDDTGRPFLLRASRDGSITSYCPDSFVLSGTNVAAERICDKPFPTATFDIQSISILSNSEAFAAGLGLFHFREGTWVREPDSNGYLSSISFASANEGWAATTGSIYGSNSQAYSSVATVGHWTSSPSTPRMARWPQPNRDVLESVALSPNGTGDALAVGVDARMMKFDHQVGAWDTATRLTDKTLHDVEYASSTSAWAVGEQGAIEHYDGSKWLPDPQSELLTNRSLFGVAFLGDRGYAVGSGGVILRNSGGRWTFDPASSKLTSATLYAIAPTRTGFVAVGDQATVLEESGGVWRRGESVAPLVTLPRQQHPPALYGVRVLADDTVIAGGAQSAMIRRAPGGRFSRVSLPVDGTIVALAAGGDRLLVSVAPSDAAKYSAGQLGAPQTTVLELDRLGWHDVQLDARRTIFPTGEDLAAPADAVYSIAAFPDGRAGWMVGGRIPNSPDADGHEFFSSTSAVYRFDLDGDPRPPSDTVLPPLPDGKSFAFFSESSCAQGLCASTIGTGTTADSVAQRIQDEINMMSAVPGGPSLVVFGGNMRLNGTPDEVGQFARFMRQFSVPAYGALGDRDLLPLSRAVGYSNGNSETNSFYTEGVARMPAPWGEGPTPRGLKAVPYPATQPAAGLARTHYAIDVPDASGKTLFRMFVLDSSRKNLGSSQQNPNEDQLNAYLSTMLPQTSLAGIPSVIVMNQPTLNPYALGSPANQNQDPTTEQRFDQLVATNGVKAVVSGGFPINSVYVPTATQVASGGVPFYVSGGGGRPFEQTRLAPDGFYHAWLLLTILKEGKTTKVQARVFPILDSLALHALDGNHVGGGNVLRFDALARALDGGFVDPQQTKATYFNFPPLPKCARAGFQGSTCTNANSLQPSYSFDTADHSIAQFVEWDYARDRPAYDAQGNVIPTTSSGFLCTFKAGATSVAITVGLHQSRMPVTVDGGYGPCVKKPVPPLPKLPVVKGKVVHKPQPAPKHFYHFRPTTTNAAVVVFPPIPAPVVAPAPPGSPGVGRKEEHEPSHQTEGHGEQDGHNQHRAMALERHRNVDSTTQAWMILSMTALLALLGAASAAAARERAKPSWQRTHR